MNKLLASCALLLLGPMGCSHSVHQVAVGGLEDIPRGSKSRHVEAEAEQFVILYIADDTAFADQAHRRLLAQCSRGALYGLEAHHTTSHGFLSFTNRMRMNALCVE